MSGGDEAMVTLRTNGFFLQPAVSILIGTGAGFGLMMMVIMLGGHPFLAMAALLGGICAVFGIVGGRMGFELTGKGLSREFRPFLARFIGWSGQKQFFPLADIVSFQRDTDLSRSMKEVEYLRIRLRVAPFTILITNEKDPAGFARFADGFEALVARLAQGAPPPPTAAAAAPPAAPPAAIQRKKGFYETVWAKVLTAIFVWATLGIVAALFLGEARLNAVIRLAVFIVPGTCYMVYRVFLKESGKRAGK